MSGKFVLVASYPKSGNTWARIVFSRLRQGPDFPINGLDGSIHGAFQRALFDLFSPVNASGLLAHEVENMFPEVYRQIVSEMKDPVYFKTHDTAHRNRNGEWLYPPECVQSVIYLVRHPFDVAVSTANHLGISIEKAVALLSNDDAMPRAEAWLPEPLPEFFGGWSRNALSWIDDAPYRVELARYEDLLADPLGQFERLAEAAGLSATPYSLSDVLAASTFERLQREEREQGFNERPATSKQFFRSGRAKSWEGALGDGLRQRICADHGEVMARLGYAADGGVVPMA